MTRQMSVLRTCSALSIVAAQAVGVNSGALAFDGGVAGPSLVVEETPDAPASASAEPISPAQEKDQEAENTEAIDPALLSAPLEDLLVLETTSVAKKRQSVKDSAAAVYVITQEEIRKSPAGTIVDLLRTVPGVEVGQITNSATAVSIRGFNSRNSNSLLVMIDGRSVYFSGLSGVFWDQINLPLYDIERIEVVRGPGATLWGANAVNGVINIITRNSADTLGTNVVGRASTRRQEFNVSHGFRLDDTLTMRAFGTLRRDKMLLDEQGNNLAPYAGKSAEAGTRIDWQASARDAITLQADLAYADYANLISLFNKNPLAPGYDISLTEDDFTQVNVLARWTRRQSDDLDWRMQAYYSHLERSELSLTDYTASIADIDLGINWRPNSTHDLSIGLGARRVADDFESFTANAIFGQNNKADTIISGYIQDDIALIPNRLRLSVGAKLEHNNFTGTEFQPSARIFYRPSSDLAAWASVSRAARTPSRFERTAQFEVFFIPGNTPQNPSPLPIFPVLTPNPDLRSESVTAFEAGLRLDVAQDWNIDLAGYYNRYRRVASPTPVGSQLLFAPPVPFPLAVELDTQIQARGRLKTWGIEALLTGEITPWWTIKASYSHFNFDVAQDPLINAPFNLVLPPENSPRHQAALSNDVQIASDLQLTAQLRYTDEIGGGAAGSYLSGDVRLAYDLGNGAEFAVIGEGLFEPSRIEFPLSQLPTLPSYVSRSVSAELRYRF
ncbi:TonB-dependent receptor [Erythrobacter sp. SCSIO 43205]|uniref:TonB-dependent receptor plug domain-containing protein n=1 Tax=Erythrobacter sp. SCSIO 43205 TaxID=2779361 RepID=UPI001CA81748|nr:TonB-dependent receptor [Erythrobacter sp. SCSIO 43205]UAB79357.1 TonB-dependent receptor [Erythrobacter sp. SCSIO 43205]